MRQYTVFDAMRILNVSRPTIMKWIERGKLADAKKGGDKATSGWLIPASEMERVRLERIAEIDQEISRLKEIRSRVARDMVS